MMERLHHSIMMEQTSVRKKLMPGDYFGNLQETKGKLYQPEWVISMSRELNVIKISNKGIHNIFVVQLNEENFKLLNASLSEGQSIKKLRNLSRCFVEKEYPPGKILMQEGSPIKTIYLIKTGEC